ncbi:MAG: hypothetical protein J7K98_02125, partial [Candidatus Aenigmarchaeota archaeon]|nr:hypothetical protein [Candidatus Aenigmarchaeota archaeon]
MRVSMRTENNFYERFLGHIKNYLANESARREYEGCYNTKLLAVYQYVKDKITDEDEREGRRPLMCTVSWEAIMVSLLFYYVQRSGKESVTIKNGWTSFAYKKWQEFFNENE